MSAWPHPLDPDQVARLVKVGLGQEPADLVVRGARLVNVFSQQVEEASSLAVAQGRIASLGPEAPGWVGPETRVVEAAGGYLLPGLIDAHTHLDSVLQLSAFCPAALARGNTCAVSETSMLAGAWGFKAVQCFLAEAEAQAMRIFFLAPPMVPPFPQLETSAGMDYAQCRSLLERPECLGLGESYWTAVIDDDPRIRWRLAAALEMGKRLEGHAAGARGEKLMAYAAAGITSCHESTTPAEALERLRLGLAVQVREGVVRREMEAVVPALKDLPDTRGVMLVTDTASHDELQESGSMNPLLAKAVALGVEPARAVAWCSLNPAKYFGLDRLGALAPGYVADMVLVQDLAGFEAQAVFLEGRQVALDGRLTIPPADYQYPPPASQTMRCDKVVPAQLRVPAAGPLARVRVCQVAGDTIVREAVADLAVIDGSVAPDPGQDVLKLMHLNRHVPGDQPAVGFTSGWGLRQGALATTLIWDTCNLMALGASEEEIALAANRVRELGGGMVVAAGQRILAELPLPLAGVISPAPLEQINQSIADLSRALSSLGCSLARPFLTAQTFCFTGLPFLRLTDRGLVDVRRRRLVKVLLD